MALKKTVNTCKREEIQDLSTNNHAVEAGVMEFDIFGKLIYK